MTLRVTVRTAHGNAVHCSSTREICTGNAIPVFRVLHKHTAATESLALPRGVLWFDFMLPNRTITHQFAVWVPFSIFYWVRLPLAARSLGPALPRRCFCRCGTSGFPLGQCIRVPTAPAELQQSSWAESAPTLSRCLRQCVGLTGQDSFLGSQKTKLDPEHRDSTNKSWNGLEKRALGFSLLGANLWLMLHWTARQPQHGVVSNLEISVCPSSHRFFLIPSEMLRLGQGLKHFGN